MAKMCPHCGRANPDEAFYCYADGHSLAGDSAQPAPARPADDSEGEPAEPLVFPSGRRCTTWNEIITGCYEEWRDARGMLYSQVLERYFTALDRPTLARAARRARRHPDRDRGLDYLLSQVPATVLRPAQLGVEPEEIRLSQLVVGERRSFELHLINQGMRLLDGRVETKNPEWLRLAPGSDARRLNFRGKEMTLTIEVDTRTLPSNKHYSGSLHITSTGGDRTLPVELEVLPVPFGLAPMAGAYTPGELAARARDHLRMAVPLFESGEVRRWFERNNWAYPIRGPEHRGLTLIQQYLDGLGLVPPPQITVMEERIDLVCPPRTAVPVEIHLTSQGGGIPYGSVAADQPWLQVRTRLFTGRQATIALEVRTAELVANQVYSTTVTIEANGRHRITVPVTVRVEDLTRGPWSVVRGLLAKDKGTDAQGP